MDRATAGRILAAAFVMSVAFLCRGCGGGVEPPAPPYLVPDANLPVADQAKPGEESRETTIEIPLTTHNDTDAFLEQVKARCDTIVNFFKKKERPGSLDDVRSHDEGAVIDHTDFDFDFDGPVLTLRADRRVTYPLLGRTITAASDKGIGVFRLACQRGESKAGRAYLLIKLPAALAGDPKLRKPPLIELECLSGGTGMTYRLRVSTLELGLPEVILPPEDLGQDEEREDRHPPERFERLTDLEQATARLVEQHDARFALVRPSGDASVQDFVDLYNCALKAGIKYIALAKSGESEERP